MRILAGFLFTALCFAQGGPPTITVSQDPPPVGTCVDTVQVGNVIIRSNNTAVLPVGVYRCTQILDPSVYGAGAFAWQPIGHYSGPTLPAKCDVGSIAFRTGATAGQNIYGCTSANTWTAQAGGGGGGGNPGGITGQIQFNAAGAFGGLTLPVGIVKGSAGPALIAATPGSDYELPLTFGSGLSRTSNAVTIPAAGVSDTMLAGSIGTSKLATRSGNGPAVATTTGTLTSGHCTSIDAAGNLVDAGIGCASGSGVTTLNGLTSGSAPSQTFAKTDDTNVTIGISSSGTVHTFAMGWTGRLAKARQSSATAYTDASNSFVSTQDFGSADFLRIPTAAGYTPTLAGHIGYDLTSNAYVGFTGAKKTFAFLDSNITGTAANLSGAPALPNGTTAATQTQADGSTKLATNAYVDTGLATKSPLIAPGFTAPLTLQNPTAAYEGPTLGAELVSGSGWTSTNWTGSWGAGWTHTAGNVSALSFPISITSGHTYQLVVTIASATAGAVGISLGGVAGVNYSNGGLNVYGANGTYYFGPTVSGTAALTFTPAIGGSFNGTLQGISVKEITGASTPTFTAKDSSGTASSEWRISVAALSNISVGGGAGRLLTAGAVNNNFFGGGSGTNATTGQANNGYGHASLGSLTHGWNNTASGEASGYKITSGYGNVCNGVDTCGFGSGGMTGYHNAATGNYSGFSLTTGFQNSLHGPYSGYNLTTGSDVVAQGMLSGAYLADGVTPNTDSTQSIYLGGVTKAKQAGVTDEIVIGYNATGHGSHTGTYGSPSITDHYFSGVIHPDGISTGGSYSAGGPAVTLTTGVAASRPACSTSPIAYLATDTHALTVCNTTTTAWGAALNPAGSFGEIFNLGTGLWECYTDAAASCAPAGGGGGSGTGNPYIATISCSTSPTSILQSTHLQGAYPYIVFTDSSNSQVGPGSMTLASNGNITVSCGSSVTLKIYVSGAVGAHPNIPQTFTSVSSVVMYGINNGFGSPYAKAQLWDNATPRNWIIPGAVATDSTTFNTTITFSNAVSGLAILAAN